MTHLIGYYEQSSPCTYNMSKHPTPESNIRNLYGSVKDKTKYIRTTTVMMKK